MYRRRDGNCVGRCNTSCRRARCHGLRPLIRYLVRVVGRLVRSGRRWRLDFARTNYRLDWLYNAAVQLE